MATIHSTPMLKMSGRISFGVASKPIQQSFAAWNNCAISKLSFVLLKTQVMTIHHNDQSVLLR